VPALSDMIQHGKPLSTGASAVYPYAAALERKMKFESRFGEEVLLSHADPLAKLIYLPRALCPVGEKDERDRLFELMEVVTIFYASKLDDKARAYLKERGMEDAIIKEFRVGFAGNAWTDASDFLKGKKFTDAEIIDAGMAKKNERGGLVDKFRNRIMFPIADSAGRVIAFSGRSFGEHASPEAPKYLNSPETPLYHKSRVLYGFDKAKVPMRKLACAVLVENPFSARSPASSTNTRVVIARLTRGRARQPSSTRHSPLRFSSARRFDASADVDWAPAWSSSAKAFS